MIKATKRQVRTLDGHQGGAAHAVSLSQEFVASFTLDYTRRHARRLRTIRKTWSHGKSPSSPYSWDGVQALVLADTGRDMLEFPPPFSILSRLILPFLSICSFQHMAYAFQLMVAICGFSAIPHGNWTAIFSYVPQSLICKDHVL